MSTEALAIKHHGENWNQLIDDVADAFFVNYTIADPITESSSYDPYLWAAQAITINEDMNEIEIANNSNYIWVNYWIDNNGSGYTIGRGETVTINHIKFDIYG